MVDAFAGITGSVTDIATRLDVYSWTLLNVARRLDRVCVFRISRETTSG